MDHLEALRARIRDAAVSRPPAPWAGPHTHAVGGLTEVGFAEDSDLLLIVSSQGRGVFNCANGERIARDPSELDDNCYDVHRLRGRGIGPIADQSVRLVGLHGGGLASTSADGWSVESITLSWPDQHLLLIEPRGSLYSPTATFTRLAVEREVRAFGFSSTGRTLLIATSSELVLFPRSR